MRIGITPHELMEKGLWDKFCDMTGTSVWAVKEGLLDSDDNLHLTEQQAIKLGLLPDKEFLHRE